MSTMDNAQKLDLIIRKLDELVAKLDAKKPATTAPARAAAPGEAVIPFGRSKGHPVAGAKLADLQWVAGAVRTSIEDPAKERWADSNRALLAALEAEIAAQTGAPVNADIPF